MDIESPESSKAVFDNYLERRSDGFACASLTKHKRLSVTRPDRIQRRKHQLALHVALIYLRVARVVSLVRADANGPRASRPVLRNNAPLP